jgi:hypothetical protein
MPPDDIDVVAEVVERFLDRCHQRCGVAERERRA